DLHVFRGLPALHPARQEPGDRLGGQVQLVRDLLLGEALLLVLEGPLRDRVHVFHPFTRSNSRDAACRISRYRTRVDALFARLVRATPFDGLRNAFILYSNGSRMYFIGRDPAGIAGRPLALTTDRAQTGTRRPLLSRSDRKSTRLNSSHVAISYAVFCLKKKKKQNYTSRVNSLCQPTVLT